MRNFYKVFFDMSQELLTVLQGKISSEPFATGGYILIAHVKHGQLDRMLVAMLTDVIGAAINEELDLIEAVHLQLEHLRVAGCINLTEWLAGEDYYVSFLRGRKDPADYFKKFLGCNNVVKARDETRKLVEAIRQFAQAQELDEFQRDQLHQDAFDYCTECVTDDKPVSFDVLANRLWPENPEVLCHALSNPMLQLSDHFIPHTASLRQLVKFRAKTATWTLEFDRKAMRNGDLDYKREEGILILKNLPQELQDRLTDEFNGDHD